MSVRWSISRLVRRSVGWLVGNIIMLSSNLAKNGILKILNDLDTAGRGRKRDEEERGTRRKEGQGRRRGEEEGRRRKEEGRGE